MSETDISIADLRKVIRMDERAALCVSNLRCVSQRENMRNAKLSALNTSGVSGVSWSRRQGQWGARIGDGGKVRFLGWFDVKDDAVAARRSAERELGYHPNHGRLAA